MTVDDARRKAVVFVVSSMFVALIQSLFLSYLFGVVFDYYILQELFGIKPGSSTQIVVVTITVIVVVRLGGFCIARRRRYLDDKAEAEEEAEARRLNAGPVLSQEAGGGQSFHIQDPGHAHGEGALSDPLIAGAAV